MLAALPLSLAFAQDLAPPPIVPQIINGEAAALGDYPMTGAVLMDGVGGGYALPVAWCSSTLIAPDVVLLAAHCVDEQLIQTYYPGIQDVQLYWSREPDLSAYDGSTPGLALPADAVAARAWVYHAGYSLLTFQSGIAKNDDIALLFLDAPQYGVPYASVPTAEEAAELVVGAPVVVVGWGQQTADAYPPPGTIGVKRMGESQVDQLGDHEFQVGAAASDVRQCHGDSGGPVFQRVSGGLRVVGVTSHSYDVSDCAVTGGVNTRVDAYLDWLDGQMRAACDGGTRAWCDEPGLLYGGAGVAAGPNWPLSLGDDDELSAGCAYGGSPPAGAWLAAVAALAWRKRRYAASSEVTCRLSSGR